MDAVAESEFAEQVGDVGFHGVLAEDELGCDLGVGKAVGECAEDLDLAVGLGFPRNRGGFLMLRPVER